MSGRAMRMAAWGLVAVLGGCASADPRLYTLVAMGPAGAPVTLAAGGPGRVVELRRVSVPSYLDRPEIVRSAADYRVKLATNDRWSEPLGDLLQRVLAEDLTRRLPGASVVSASGLLGGPAGMVVDVVIGRLDSDGAGQVVLEAQYLVRVPDGAGDAAPTSVRLTVPTGADTAGYAAAISAAMAGLADRIAARVAG